MFSVTALLQLLQAITPASCGMGFIVEESILKVRGEFENLKHATIEGLVGITSIDGESFHRLKSIQSLKIASCGDISVLVEWVCSNLTDLREFCVNHTELTAIPESIRNLQYLDVLDLESNKLEFLPESVGQLRHLSELYIGSNQLRKLPNSIGRMHSLTILHIGYNPLEDIPDSFMSLTNLDILNIGCFTLKSMPSSIEELKRYLHGREVESTAHTTFRHPKCA